MARPTEKTWTDLAEKSLKGRTVTAVRWMSDEEAEDLGWSSRPVVIQFDDGTLVFPAADDEGNDGGALFGQKDGKEIMMPVLSVGFPKG